MKVDIHTHILPHSWPNLKERYGYGGFIQLCHCEDGSCDMMKVTVYGLLSEEWDGEVVS